VAGGVVILVVTLDENLTVAEPLTRTSAANTTELKLEELDAHADR
jgi:hypothetical protein